MGLFALAGALAVESPHLPATGAEWGAVLWLAVVCSGFGFTLQPLAQRGTTAQRASMFCALSPVSAALLGRIFLQEHFGLRGMAGAALVLAGIGLTSLRGRLPVPKFFHLSHRRPTASVQ